MLLLDDAASAEQVEPLLPHPECLTLVTSRHRFALPALYRQDLDSLTAEAARDLLLRLAPRLGEAADEIAGLLGRLPLALRLAGSAFAERPGLEPAEYLRRLANRDERVGLVAAVIDFSYRALASELRRRWRMLAIFPGGFDAAGAGAVWDLDAAEAEEVLGGELLRGSLVEHRDGRYRLHDLARDFAATRLEAGEGDTAGRRHAGHYGTVLDRADRLYQEGGESIAEGLTLYDREWGNVRAGQAWAAAHAAGDREAVRLCSKYPRVGAYCLGLRLHPREQIRWLEAARQAATELGDRAAEGRHLGNLGLAYADLGESRRAIEHHEQHLAIAQENGDRRGEGSALGSLGVAYRNLGESRRAIEYHEQWLAIAREIGDRRGEANSYWNLGQAYEKLGELERAVELMQVCVDFEREIGHRDAEQDAERVAQLRRNSDKS